MSPAHGVKYKNAFLCFTVVQVVEFNVDSGAMALDRWNLFHCGIFRYSCALENVNKLEITEVRGVCCSAWQCSLLVWTNTPHTGFKPYSRICRIRAHLVSRHTAHPTASSAVFDNSFFSPVGMEYEILVHMIPCPLKQWKAPIPSFLVPSPPPRNERLLCASPIPHIRQSFSPNTHTSKPTPFRSRTCT